MLPEKLTMLFIVELLIAVRKSMPLRQVQEC